jgi:hypothetical protein
MTPCGNSPFLSQDQAKLAAAMATAWLAGPPTRASLWIYDSVDLLHAILDDDRSAFWGAPQDLS